MILEVLWHSKMVKVRSAFVVNVRWMGRVNEERKLNISIVRTAAIVLELPHACLDDQPLDEDNV